LAAPATNSAAGSVHPRKLPVWVNAKGMEPLTITTKRYAYQMISRILSRMSRVC